MKFAINLFRILSVGLFACGVAASSIALADGFTEHHDSDRDESRFEFALWGDLPYAKNGDDPKMANLISSMNSARLEFTIFDGDTKDGSSVCVDAPDRRTGNCTL